MPKQEDHNDRRLNAGKGSGCVNSSRNQCAPVISHKTLPVLLGVKNLASLTLLGPIRIAKGEIPICKISIHDWRLPACIGVFGVCSGSASLETRYTIPIIRRDHSKVLHVPAGLVIIRPENDVSRITILQSESISVAGRGRRAPAPGCTNAGATFDSVAANAGVAADTDTERRCRREGVGDGGGTRVGIARDVAAHCLRGTGDLLRGVLAVCGANWNGTVPVVDVAAPGKKEI